MPPDAFCALAEPSAAPLLDIPLATIIDALAHAPGAPGRLERIVTTRSDTPAVFVDYAHTPDAISRALLALAPYCRGQLIIVFGCGGDRDRTKRPLMGAAAVDVADVVWVTSDNPRTENPETIVAEILAGLAQEHKPAKVHVQIDRRTAIEQAIASAQANDVVLIAGKGHEDYQILGTTKIPFSDHEVARAVLNEA